MTENKEGINYRQQVVEKYGDSTRELSEIDPEASEKALVIERGRLLKPYVAQIEGELGQNGDRRRVVRVIKSGVTDLRESEERTLPEDTRVILIRAPGSVY